MRGYIVLRQSPKHRASIRARNWTLKRYPSTVGPLGVNDRQWIILNKTENSVVVGGKAYYARHRVTGIQALIAAEDCEQIIENPH